MADGTVKIDVELDGSKAKEQAKGVGDEVGKEVESGAGKASDAFGKMGEVASKVVGIATAAFGALTTSVAAISTQALNAYSDYEQLTGGISKLFGTAGKSLEEYAASVGKSTDEAAGKYSQLQEAQDKMFQNAQNAYKTAGLSANDYMTQVTSFSASLISSLGGDTSRAADMANLAMSTMADNVNVFGSNMSDVQNAFQGFAKQNYTMLDNLKLGYGGTQAEMQRLIEHANTLPAVMKAGNDLSINSFADVVEAIARVQQEQGIMGTTANEAATTIEGSINMTKAAWENLLTAFGTGDPAMIQGSVDALLESLGNVAQNVIPRMALIGDAVVQALPGIVSKVGETLAPLLSQTIATAWNIAVQALSGLGIQLPQIDATQVQAAFQAISDAAGQLAAALGPTVSGALNVLIDALQWIVTNGATVGPILAGIVGAFLAFQAIQAVLGILTALSTALIFLGSPIGILVVVIGALIAAFVALATNAGGCRDTIVNGFMAVVDFFSELPGKIGAFLGQLASDFMKWATESATNFYNGLKGKIDEAINFISQVPGKIGGFLASLAGDLLSKAQEAGSNFLNGIKNGFQSAVDFVGSIPGRIAGALGDLGGLLVGAGKAIMDGLLSGIKSAFESVKNFVGNIAGWIAEHKGPIPYDLKLLIPNGQAIMESLATGLRKGMPEVLDVVEGIAPQISLGVTAAGAGQLAASQAASVTSQTVNRAGDTYNFYEPVKTPAETARAIRMQQTYGLAGAR